MERERRKRNEESMIRNIDRKIAIIWKKIVERMNIIMIMNCDKNEKEENQEHREGNDDLIDDIGNRIGYSI